MSSASPIFLSKSDNKLSFEFRLYVWSILAEPLLYFVLDNQDNTGVNLTYARILQITFLAILLFKYFLRPRIVILPNPLGPHYKYFAIYIAMLLITSVIGIVFYDSYNLLYIYEDWNIVGLSDLIRGPYSRPFVEIGVLFYYFIYFIFLPKRIIKTKAEIQYLFKWIIRIINIMLLLGFLDLILQLTTGWYIPKHSSYTEFGYVGLRFHALLGEPRDAVPYLFFAMSILYIWHTVNNNIKHKSKLIVMCVIALIMTQSTSGLIGLGLSGIALVFAYLLTNIKKFIHVTVIGIILSIIALYLMSLSLHVMQYVNVFSEVLDALTQNSELPVVATYQVSNFLPFWAMWLEIQQLNVMPVLFGSGIGSVSFVNNNLIRIFVEDATGGLFNPNAQFTRIIYEAGFIGAMLYIYALYYPVKIFMKKYPINYNINFIFFVLLMGACLAHRHTIIFVYVGLVIMLNTNWSYDTESKVRKSPMRKT